jgi:hypothetical protein
MAKQFSKRSSQSLELVTLSGIQELPENLFHSFFQFGKIPKKCDLVREVSSLITTFLRSKNSLKRKRIEGFLQSTPIPIFAQLQVWSRQKTYKFPPRAKSNTITIGPAPKIKNNETSCPTSSSVMV